MATIRSRPGRPAAVDELAAYPGSAARVVATPREAGLLLRQAHVAGRLASLTPPRPAGGGLVAVDVRLHPLPTTRRRTRRRVAAVTVAAAVLVGALSVAAVIVAVQWLAAHLAAVLTILVLLGVPLIAAGKRAGPHRPGRGKP